MVKRVYSRFDNQRKWSDEGSSTTRPVSVRKFEEPVSMRKDETQTWLESGTGPSDVAKGLSGDQIKKS